MSSRRRIKRKLDRKQLIEKLSTKCPRCRKTAASSEEEAWEIARKQYARNGGEMPKRVYECWKGSGIYHWTRDELPPLRVIKPDASFYAEDRWT